MPQNRLTGEQLDLLQKAANLADQIASLAERLRGIGMTPKKMREQRWDAMQAERKGKMEEYNRVAQEFNDSVSPPKE